MEGATLAISQINKSGGVLGREIQLLVEDSANDVGTGVQKARKLIDRDQVNALLGDVNSGIAYAISQVTNEKRVFSHRAWWAHRSHHGQRLQMERLPRLQHHDDGRGGNHPDPRYATPAKSGSSSRPTTPMATPCRRPSLSG
ncbi:MAG: ABC transporter substrate-binding protein [Acetobacteraceae bacterium]|nr:ABC transporter substrate-binding protein [Acetobacteraceae bacterium]